MGSQWFNLEATGWNNGGYDQISCNTENNVDLTLKLGLPNDHDQHHLHQHFGCTTNLVANQPAADNLDFNGLIGSSQGTRQYYVKANGRDNAYLNHHGAGCGEAGIQNHRGIINQGAAGVRRYGIVNGDNLHEPWNHPDYLKLNNDTSIRHTGSVVGIPDYHDAYNSFNRNQGISPTLTMNGNTLLDAAARLVDHGHEIGSSTGSRRRSTRRQLEESPNKRCTNYSCNTNDTPMWRKGPSGPKTLCNACGIKYRKEEEKRRAREVAKRTNGN